MSKIKYSILAMAVTVVLTGCIHDDSNTMGPIVNPSIGIPALPDNPNIPADAPTTPNNPIAGQSFKVSLDLVAANKNASSPLALNDMAKVLITSNSEKNIKELTIKLATKHFEQGYVVFEIDTLSQGQYEMTQSVVNDTTSKYTRDAVKFEVLKDGTIHYDVAIKNWSMLWTPPNTEDSQYQAMIEAKIDKAATSYAGFVKDNPDHLWPTIPLYKDYGDGKLVVHEKNTKATLFRLRDMAVAYTLGDPTFTTQEVLDDILFGLEFVLADFYNETLVPHKKDNWHEWEIGTPKVIHDIVSLVYEHVPQSMIDDVVNATRAHLPDPTKQYANNPHHNQTTNTGANRVDTAMVVMQRGMFAKNDAEIEAAIAALPTVLEPVTEKDGFYSDGSFIQHQDIPYIGTYGMILLSNISRIMIMLDQTGVSLDDPRYQLVDEYLFSAVEPFLYKAQMMEAVSGRAIARGWSQNKGEGRGALSVLLRYYDSRSPEVKARLGQLIKGQLQTDTDAFFANASDFKVLDVADRILKDDSIKVGKEREGNFLFYNMDRMVHRGHGYAFTVAMHSNRIGNYECLPNHNENMKGWYTGDGMTYLYDADHNQYTDWYPLIDSRKIAGATTTGENIGLCQGRNTYGNKKKDMTWVGGVSNGLYGVMGMNFINSSQGVDPSIYYKTTAKKSYFAFDDELVMIGSDIRSDKATGVATYIENRALNKDGSNKITVDGSLWSPVKANQNDDFASIKATKTYHVEGNVAGSQVGVFLPIDDAMELRWDDREGNWKDIYPVNDKNMTDTHVEGVILQTMIAHQTANGQNDDYAYVMLPTYTSAQTTDYANNPDIEIVAQTENLHAVKEKTRNVLAANNFTKELQTSAAVETQGELSVLMSREGNTVNVWISQPSRTNEMVDPYHLY